jgi:DNA topoisomerase-1
MPDAVLNGKNSTNEAAEWARRARLRYTTDGRPGIRRVACGAGFRYLGRDRKTIHDDRVRDRIRHLAIPPAWTDVWICPDASGHLQATGRDHRGRKQFRYHPRWSAARADYKYGRMISFGRALPSLRRTVRRHLALRGLPGQKVLAGIIQLLERTLIRVGNDEYALQNGSYGLTTMRDKHAQVKGAHVWFRFQGKSGARHLVEVSDRRLAVLVRSCRDLPGDELFQYVGRDGRVCDVSSADVNTYLREITGHYFSAKDFRTWAATVMAASILSKTEAPKSKTDGRRKVAQAVRSVAERLGNTPAVCRKSYVHPGVIAAYLDGSLPALMAKGRGQSRTPRGLGADETATLMLLERLGRRRSPAMP